METVTVTCPHCGFSRKIPRSAIPPRTVSARCPGCSKNFSFSAEDAFQAEASPSPSEETLSVPSHSISRTSEPPPSFAEQTETAPAPKTLRFSFTGQAGEYFGIWIVNNLLKMMTFGIYSPWAKVRKRRFFFGHTLLHDSPFDYLADPMVLFKGWLIAAGFFILYSVGGQFVPILGMIFGLIFFLAVPWLVVRSRRYNSTNSSYRNIRFNFRAAYREAYVVFAGLYLLVPFTFGLIVPYLIYRQKRFLVENGGYGSTPFYFSGTAGDYYRVYLKALLVALIMGALIFIPIMVATTVFSPQAITAMAKNPAGAALASAVPLLLLLPLYFCVFVYLKTSIANLTWNRTGLGDGMFTSTLRTRNMLWLYLSNAAAIVCSMGLAIPWASVRLARYRFENLSMETAIGLDGFLSVAGEELTATGEEIGDLFGIEMDLAL